jgi:hypothetical protein
MIPCRTGCLRKWHQAEPNAHTRGTRWLAYRTGRVIAVSGMGGEIRPAIFF